MAPSAGPHLAVRMEVTTVTSKMVGATLNTCVGGRREGQGVRCGPGDSSHDPAHASFTALLRTDAFMQDAAVR